jgi:hypothetical protein
LLIKYMVRVAGCQAPVLTIGDISENASRPSLDKLIKVTILCLG